MQPNLSQASMRRRHLCVFLTSQHDPCPLAPHARALRVVSASCLRTQNQIFFDEFFRVARDRIKVNKVKLIDEQLKALWCVLDPNDVNWIQFPDVVLFLKRGSDGERAIRRAQKVKEKRERTLAARAANAFIEWAPTRTYRAALEERGVALPGTDTLMALAKQINDALEEKRKDEKNKNAVQEKTSGQPTTFKIFKEMDEDRSGFLSFDEFQWALRQKLWLSKSKLSDDMLMAIWCILDWGTRLAATSIFVFGRDTATNPSRTPTREPPCQPPRGRHLRPAWPNYIAHSPRAHVCGARIRHCVPLADLFADLLPQTTTTASSSRTSASFWAAVGGRPTCSSCSTGAPLTWRCWRRGRPTSTSGRGSSTHPQRALAGQAAAHSPALARRPRSHPRSARPRRHGSRCSHGLPPR